jgi:hypothetical protein
METGMRNEKQKIAYKARLFHVAYKNSYRTHEMNPNYNRLPTRQKATMKYIQSIAGTPVRCDAGDADPLPHQEQPDHAQNPEHLFFVEWEKAERERLRQEHVDKWLDDLTSDRSADA